jgi:hypothetical protein
MQVLNKHKHGIPAGAVYIGRGSKWGNPFVIGPDGTREDVVAKYRDYLLHHPTLALQVNELQGRDLVCFCSPQACHGDVLIEFVNLLYGENNLH